VGYKFTDAALFAACFLLVAFIAYSSTMQMEAEVLSETSVNVNGIALRHKVPLFVVTAVRTSVLTKMLTFVTYQTIFRPIVNPCESPKRPFKPLFNIL
jgi:hypothetical protein